MTIIEVRTRRKSLYALVLSEPIEDSRANLDDSGYLLIDRKAFDESGYRAGSDISYEELDELIYMSAYSRACGRALYYLSRRDWAQKEIADKLTREFGAEASNAAAERMVELSLIDDERYAARCAEILLLSKGVSPSYAVRELCAKGIDRDVAESAVSEVGTDSCETINRLVETKYARLLADGTEKSRNRVFNALARKGFSYSDIRCVIDRFVSDDDRFCD